MNLDSLKALTELVLRHRDEREWAQFHNPKDLAISLCVEAAELLSLMQWQSGEQLAETLRSRSADLRDELADVLHSTLLLAAHLEIDLGSALREKIAKDAAKYPIEKARGKNLKYNEL